MELRRWGWGTVAALALLAGTASPAYAIDEETENGYGSRLAQPIARVGADLGYGRIEHENYALVNATGLFRVYYLRADFWLPFRFNVNGFAFRGEDYDDVRDIARIPRCVRIDLGDFRAAPDGYDPTCQPYANAESVEDRNRVYFNARMTPLSNITLGHGTLMYNYRNSIDPDQPQLGAISTFNFHNWFQADAVVDDVFNPNILGVRVAGNPLNFILGDTTRANDAGDSVRRDEFEIGATLVTDLFAPLRQQTAFGRPVIDRTGALQFTRSNLTAFTVDLHYLGMWLGGATAEDTNAIGFMAYADYNRFVQVEDGDALHGGAFFRWINRQGGYRQWQVDLGAEYRFMGNRYLPEYFDTNYVIQSEQFALNADARRALGTDAAATSKLAYMLGRPGGRTHGLQGFLRFVIPIPTGTLSNGQPRPPSRLPIQMFIEDADGPLNASISLMAGPWRLDQIEAWAIYQRRNFDDLSGVFNPEGALLSVGGRLYLMNPDAPNQATNPLRNLSVNVSFDRRFYLDQRDAQYDITNDLRITLNYAAGFGGNQ